jgi:hypothetical protein
MKPAKAQALAIGTKRIYSTGFVERGRSVVIKWEVMRVEDGDDLSLQFESVESTWRQGVWLQTDSGLLVNGIKAPSVTLWQDTAPVVVQFTCFTRNGFLSFYNIWHSGRDESERESQSYSSGMLAEEFSGGCRYYCNDIGFDTEFRKLVFSIHRATGRRA